MTVEEALVFVETLLAAKSLNTVEVSVFRQAWDGLSYQEMADRMGYEVHYIRNVGYRLWKSLSRALGEDITKANFRSRLRSKQAQTLGAIPATNHQPCQDWGDAPDILTFYGRSVELNQLEQWIVSDRCRLIGLFGMGGIGKTALAVKLIQTVQDQFEVVIWRSLRNAPLPDALLVEIVQRIAPPQESCPAPKLDEALTQLFQWLQSSRCLLILDNIESVLQQGEQSGVYREGYEGYGRLLRQVSECAHSSCLILTGREQPQGLATRAAEQGLTRLWSLGGLPVLATQPLLNRMGVQGTDADVQALTLSYAGNPLALKIAATAIRDLFGGVIAPFLAQGGILLRDIRELLDRQMQRLSDLERVVMYGLAIAREGVSLETLQRDLLDCGSPSQLMDVVNGLLRRSLVEAGTRGFTQQPVIMEYFTQQFVDCICAELATAEPVLLHQHALLNVQAPDYLCDAQKRVILDPIVGELKRRYPHPVALNTQLQTVLSRLRQLARDRPSYGAGNIINLLRA
ncbi:MAG: NB-ARC domain-containing protein, partial [Thermosynechococcaceae cyanobacterium]